ncbi:hypothetical protein [Mesorhizobium sp. L48C026A00]|uniref:hypothetical protein n=1 Tax=Mesorhizobium sp. L48C026A00 TaxID=1287182 RepID=UPI0012EB7CAE|nr:hypothetical protein [Mesorhizobium sp. L48C026A00]
MLAVPGSARQAVGTIILYHFDRRQDAASLLGSSTCFSFNTLMEKDFEHGCRAKSIRPPARLRDVNSTMRENRKKLPARNDGFAIFDFSTATQSIDPDQSA